MYVPHLLVPTLLLGSAVAQSFEQVTATLAAAETVDESMVGDDGAKTATWLAFQTWTSLASEAQLRAATDHKSPIVRCYAVRALVATEAKVDWVALLTRHLDDAAAVTTRGGCVTAKELAGDVMFQDARPRMTEAQLLDLAEALLARKSPLYARQWALRNLRFRDAMLHDIRRLASEGDPPAAIALARYRLPSDVPLLCKRLQQDEPFDDNCHFLAAEVHADPRLLPPLIAFEGKARTRLGHDNAYRLRFWLAAIAAQRSDEAATFLQRFLHDTTDAKQRADLAATCAMVLESFADCAAFRALRAELPPPREW
jgi:hypothetical protein